MHRVVVVHGQPTTWNNAGVRREKKLTKRMTDNLDSG